MTKEGTPVRENKMVTNSPRIVPEREKKIIKDNPYSGEQLIDRGEYLSHPPKKP